jgi:hypothetical protein
LGEATYVVNEGLPLSLFDEGDFWASFAAGAQPGQRVWADPGNGLPIAGGATAPELDAYTADAGFGGTASQGFGGTASQGAAFTIAVATNVATVSAITDGWIDEGSVVTSAGIAGVALGARLTGTVGGVGTFTFVHGDVAAEAGTAANDVATVSVVAQGALQVGSVIDGAGADAEVLAFLGAAAGGVGSYQVDTSARVAPGAVIAETDVVAVTVVAQGALQVGSVIDSAGADATVVAFGTGAGGVGTYEVDTTEYIASAAVTAETDVLNVSAVTTGPIEPGDPVLSSSAAPDTYIVSQLTGTPGGVGTYRVTTENYFTSEAATSEAVATPWLVNSPADAGELAKISTWG